MKLAQVRAVGGCYVLSNAWTKVTLVTFGRGDMLNFAYKFTGRLFPQEISYSEQSVISVDFNSLKTEVA